MKLKMCTAGKIFHKICLKAIRDMWPSIKGGREEKGGTQFFAGAYIRQKAEVQNFRHEW